MAEPSDLSASLRHAADAIRSTHSIVMACHVNPDGDALGSMLGLGLGLRSLGLAVDCLSADGVPEVYSFLPGADTIVRTSDVEQYDLGIVLDSGDIERIGSVLPIIKRAKAILNIDHHASARGFGDIQLVDGRSASTSEIVYKLLLELGLPITAEIANCLFTGVITDTGSFRFQNVTPDTLRLAADLVAAGAEPAPIAQQVFDNRTFAATRLLGAALTSLSSSAGGRIVWAHITKEDFISLGATDEDTEGVVNYVRGVRGADVGLFFREMTDGRVRVSLRGSETVDVGAIAQAFGGGGHRMAAGCTFQPPLAEAEKILVAAVEEALAKAGRPA